MVTPGATGYPELSTSGAKLVVKPDPPDTQVAPSVDEYNWMVKPAAFKPPLYFSTLYEIVAPVRLEPVLFISCA